MLTVNGQNARNLRDPEDRIIDQFRSQERKEKMMDKTIADSFPASDPPSSLPDPDEDSFCITLGRGRAVAKHIEPVRAAQ
jgi:hypothetical protein